MRNRFSAGALLLAAIALVPLVLAQQAPLRQGALKQSSLNERQPTPFDEWLAVRTFLRAEVSAAHSLCADQKISPEVKAQLPQLFEAKLQERVQLELMKPKKGDGLTQWLSQSEKIRACRERCRCGGYGDLLRMLPASERKRILSSKQSLRGDYARAQRLEKKTSSLEVQRCAQANASWICRSRLLEQLLRETAQ